jgi:hypothetical protein
MNVAKKYYLGEFFGPSPSALKSQIDDNLCRFIISQLTRKEI